MIKLILIFCCIMLALTTFNCASIINHIITKICIAQLKKDTSLMRREIKRLSIKEETIKLTLDERKLKRHSQNTRDKLTDKYKKIIKLITIANYILCNIITILIIKTILTTNTNGITLISITTPFLIFMSIVFMIHSLKYNIINYHNEHSYKK